MRQVPLQKSTPARRNRWLSASLLPALLGASLAIPHSAKADPAAVAIPAADLKVEWRTDLNATLAEAKQMNKLVLLRFTANWCAPCRVMDARVWPDAAVQSTLAANYLIVKADIDLESHQQLAMKYGVQAVPTLLVLDASGDEKSRGGFMSSAKLINFLEDAVTTSGESDESANVRT